MLSFRISVAAILTFMCLLVSSTAFANPKRQPQPTISPDVYAVYSAVLPHLWPWTQLDARNLVLLDETSPFPVCLPRSATVGSGVNSAIAQYRQANRQIWTLEPKLHISRSYTLIGSRELEPIRHQVIGAWDLFFERHADSGGWVQFSAVGFSSDKKTAAVYAAYQCGRGCQGGGLYLLRRNNGQWQVSGSLPPCGDTQSHLQTTGF